MNSKQVGTPILGGTVAVAVVFLATLVYYSQPAEAGQDAQARSGQDRPEKPGRGEEEKAIRKTSAAYVEALNKGDLSGLIALWAPDADYVTESGQRTQGREAIAALLKNALAEQKGHVFGAKTRSLKFLNPDVVLVDGTLENTSPDGSKESDRYALVWIRSDGKWVISSARDLPAEVQDASTPAYSQLRQLEWLIGDWDDASDKVDVHLYCSWAPNKSFLLMHYTVRVGEKEPNEVVQRVGWDPVDGIIRSWVFDSHGGFGEGYWKREGNKWVVGASGIMPEGGTGGATDSYQFVDANTFIWRSVDREVDGQPVADAEVKFVRKATPKGREAKP
jgi:uncharacterized protein (TIGR02246 family)